MSDEQKNASTVPVRRVAVSGKKAEDSKATDSPPTVDQKSDGGGVGGNTNKRADILAKAREAKRLKKQQKQNVTVDVPPSSEPDVVDSRMDDNDTDSDDGANDPVPVPVAVPLSTRKRKAVAAAVFRRFDDEDETEERARKKPKIAVQNTTDSSLRTFVLDKVIDISKLAAASGVASIGFVVLKGLAGGQLTPQPKTVAGFSSEWVKQ